MLNDLRATMQGYTVKNLKSLTGNDGPVYSATLYKDGAKIAEVFEPGDGGGAQKTYANADAEKTLIADATLYGDGEGNPGLSKYVGPDIFIGHLCDTHESIKQIERQCKTKTLFRTKSCAKGEYMIIKRPYDVRARAHLVAKYGADLVCVINEELLQPAPVTSKKSKP